MKSKFPLIVVTASILILTACGTHYDPAKSDSFPANIQMYPDKFGVVESMQPLDTSAGSSGSGTAASGVIVPPQSPGQAYQLGVRLDDGSYQNVVIDNIGNIKAGDRVRVDKGRAYVK